MAYIAAFPPVQALGRQILQQLANEWVQTPVARECSVVKVVINADASHFEDIQIKGAPGDKKGEIYHFPADNFIRFVFDRAFDDPLRSTLHEHLNQLRRINGVELGQRFQSTIDNRMPPATG